MTDKNSLRALYKRKRLALSETETEQANSQIFEQFQKLDFAQFQVIHLYTPIAKWNEPSTNLLRDFLWSAGKRCATGVVVENMAEMQHVEIFPKTQFRESKWDIPEPIGAKTIAVSEIDLVIAPLLCCDINGNRVGYGKGFYDRFLASCRADVFTIGLSFFDPIEGQIDVESHDKKLNALITPKRIYTF